MDHDVRHFYLRKIHSLLGLLPIGVFIFEHFFVNAHVLNGAESFNEAAAGMAALPGLPVIEVLVLLLPITFHSIYGLMITAQARPNMVYYGYGRNIAYFIQRVTGIILLVFILVHVGSTRMQHVLYGDHIDYTYMANLFAPAYVKVFYVIGVLSATYHLANGLWNMSITWGVATTKIGQRNVLIGCALLFAAMSVVGVAVIFGFKV